MAHLIEIASTDDQIPLLPQTENDEIEEGREVHHSIDIKDTYGQAPSGSQTKKSDQILDERLKDLGNSPINSCTIFKVNVWLHESKPDAYTPKMVSIGPYHKKHPQLGRMEKYKLFYLRRFLQRNEGLDVGSCINELMKLKEEAIKCYEDIEDLNTDEFCQMLLLDGCFVVEFIRERCGIYPEGEEEVININNVGYIFQDLMLLENQLPFFVLNQLQDLTKQDDELPLEMLVCVSVPLIVDLPVKTRESFIETGGCYNIKHLLHLVHKLSCHGSGEKKSEETGGCFSIKHLLHLVHRLSCHGNREKIINEPKCHKVMPNATELSEAGVSFAKPSNIKSNNDNFTSLFDIKFENGVMTIPCLEVVDDTETRMRNLIAYEQQSVDVRPKYFCNFASFMDYLIESDKDVNFLRQKGIIVNRIGEDKVVATLFNKIGNGIITYDDDFYYKEECNKAYQHCEKWWNRIKANLIHNYFSSVWVGTSTVAASILLILTFIQTILSLKGLLSK